MNTFQQMKLKLQMGIDPAVETSSEILRDMWQQLLAERVARGRAVPGSLFHPHYGAEVQETFSSE